MTDDKLNTAAFVFFEEMEQWKRVEFRFDNVQAVRSCGEIFSCKSKDEATDLIKRRAVSALLRFYHEEMARNPHP